MAEVYKLSGDYRTRPVTGVASGQPSCETPINETVSLVRSSLQTIPLDVDTPVTVNFNGITNAHVLNVKTIGGKVTVRLTSADGSLQSIPVDTWLSLITLSVPITAIDLTRVAGTSTTVTIFLGETA